MPNKALGQHWLKDPAVLGGIADSADIAPEDTVLEIGPGLGTLTSVLLRRAKKVIAVEYDEQLAQKLPGQFPGKNLEVIHADILQFDVSRLPKGYIVVANVPYYITQKIVEKLLATDNQPERICILVQKEVAEKYAAGPGDMAMISAKLQLEYDVQLGIRVPKMYFTPPPKVDSQVVVCKKIHVSKYANINKQGVYRVIEAGFSTPRKKLRTALAGGLGVSKDVVEALCQRSGVDPDCRAQDVTVAQWVRLSEERS